jgi:hypothetical protein
VLCILLKIAAADFCNTTPPNMPTFFKKTLDMKLRLRLNAHQMGTGLANQGQRSSGFAEKR